MKHCINNEVIEARCQKGCLPLDDSTKAPSTCLCSLSEISIFFHSSFKQFQIMHPKIANYEVRDFSFYS